MVAPAIAQALFATAVGSLTRKEQRVFERRGEKLLRAIPAGRAIAVSSARKRIALPIVEVSGFQPVSQVLQAYAEQLPECLQTALDNPGFVTP